MNTTHPLHIRIPRTTFGRTDDRWALIRKHGGSRKAMVNFITSIGGYHGGRSDGPFAIEFNVATYGANLSVDNLWKLLISGDMDVGPDEDLPPEHKAQARALFWRVYDEHADLVWEWGVEEAYEQWKDSDTPFETFTGERVEWEFGLYGRGGKHLCVESVEGERLVMRDDDFEEWLNEKDEEDGTYLRSDDFLRKLFILCVQNSVELTPEAVSKEVEYRAAWRLWVSFCEDQVDGAIAAYEDRQELSEDAGVILNALKDRPTRENGTDYQESFRAICQLANITIGE